MKNAWKNHKNYFSFSMMSLVCQKMTQLPTLLIKMSLPRSVYDIANTSVRYFIETIVNYDVANLPQIQFPSQITKMAIYLSL